MSGNIESKLKSRYLVLNVSLFIGFGFALASGLFHEFNMPSLSIMVFFAIYIFENLRKPVGISYISNMFEDKVQATAMSAESQAKTLAAALIAPLLGLLADKLGVGYALVGTSSLLILLGLFLRVKADKK